MDTKGDVSWVELTLVPMSTMSRNELKKVVLATVTTYMVVIVSSGT